MRAANPFVYGALGLPLAFAALPIYVHVPRLYAEHAGLALGLLGALFLGARLFDAVSDPLLGWLADRLPKRRMVLFALLPLVLGFVSLLNPPPVANAPWLLVSLLLTYLGFSAASIAYQAWGADLGQSADERTRLTAAREGLGLLGVLAAASLPSLLAGDLASGLARLCWVFVPLLLLGALISLRVQEVKALAPVQVPTAGWSSLRGVLCDPALRRLLAMVTANGIAAAVPATLVLFFVSDVLGLATYAGGFLGLYFLAGVVGMPLWVKLAAAWGRERAWLLGMAISSLAFAGVFALGPGDGLAYALICAATGLALGADLTLPAAIAADIAERLQQAGAVFGLWNFVTKLNLALAAGLALPLLGWLGYQPGGTQTATSMGALSAVYALLPLAFKLLAATLLWRQISREENFS